MNKNQFLKALTHSLLIFIIFVFNNQIIPMKKDQSQENSQKLKEKESPQKGEQAAQKKESEKIVGRKIP